MDWRKKKRFTVYIPLPRSRDLHLLHNLHVQGQIYIGEHKSLPVTGLDMVVPGDLSIAGKILVKTDLAAGLHDKVVHGDLVVEGSITVGV